MHCLQRGQALQRCRGRLSDLANQGTTRIDLLKGVGDRRISILKAFYLNIQLG
jgi:hypothetical protein